MARPRNQANIDNVMAAARRLFRRKGYAGTSYSDLSAESGVSRPAVQDYFPKKRNLAIEQLQRLREVCASLAEKELPEFSHPLAHHFALGQIWVAALMSCEESRRFLGDILEDRSLMEEEIASDLQWSVGLVGADEVDHSPEREELFQDTVAAMGGLYELMFYSVRTGNAIDAAKRLKPGMRNLAILMGIAHEECERILDAGVVEGALLDRLGRAAFEEAFA